MSKVELELSEYENLKERIAILENQASDLDDVIESYKDILTHLSNTFRIPPHIIFDPYDCEITTEICENPKDMNFIHNIRIKYDVKTSSRILAELEGK